MAKAIDFEDLDSWARLNQNLTKLDEKACWKLLEHELAGKKREQHLSRIFGRANRLRTVRQRKSLSSGKLAGDRP